MNTKQLPPVTQVAEYVWMIPHVLPSDHPEYIATYVVEDKAGDIHVIDPGWDSDENWGDLNRGLIEIGRKAKDVHSVTLTHQHKDHVGMALHLRAESGCPVAIHESEQLELSLDFLPHAQAQRAQLLDRWCVPQDYRDVLLEELDTQTPNIPPAINADVLLNEGDFLLVPGRNLFVHHTPGHTPGHICIEDRDAGHVFTGDHVLGEFNPGVGLGKIWRPDAMVSYLASLQKIQDIKGATGFPGHGSVIADVSSRSSTIMAHHLKRISLVSEQVSEFGNLSAWEVAERLTWTKPWAEMSPTTRRMVIAQSDMYLHAALENKSD